MYTNTFFIVPVYNVTFYIKADTGLVLPSRYCAVRAGFRSPGEYTRFGVA